MHSLSVALSGDGDKISVVTSRAEVMTDYWQGRNGQIVEQTVPPDILVIRCPIANFPGGRRALMLWRKVMVLLSSLPGDQTAVLLHMSRRFPHIQHLDAVLDGLIDKIDIIHGFNTAWEYPLVAGWQMAQKRRLPFVVTPFMHSDAVENGRLSRLVMMDHQKRMLQEASRVLTLTAVGKASLIGHGVSPENIDVIGAGIDPLPERENHRSTLARFDLTSPYAIFIGRASYDKGAIHAAQAILQLRRRGVEATLVLVGMTEPAFDRFYRRLSSADRNRIRPFGILSEADKNALLAGSRLLLLPSRMDSFGIVLLEAWSYGKPVIGARSGGIPGVIDDGIDGLLVPFGNVDALAEAVQKLWQNDTLRTKMGRHGQKKTAAKYTWSQVAGRTLAHYRQLLTNNDKHGQVAF